MNEKLNAGALITLDEHFEPAVRLAEGEGERLVPVRLRDDQDNLTLAWHGHAVINLEWTRAYWFDEAMASEASTWILVGDHDKQQCRRCALAAESEQADEIVSVKRTQAVDWAHSADRAQAFHRDYIARWDERPDQLDPMLDRALTRERARVCVGAAGLGEWLDLAARYVHARMRQVWIEEDYLALTRTWLMGMRYEGYACRPPALIAPRFEYQGVVWRVDADGATERREIRERDDGITTLAWIADANGYGLPGYHEALNTARWAVSQLAQRSGERRIRSSEIEMEMNERQLNERTLGVREQACAVRGRLVEVTRAITGA